MPLLIYFALQSCQKLDTLSQIRSIDFEQMLHQRTYSVSFMTSTLHGRVELNGIGARGPKRVAVVVLYAIAMAWVESAVVYYLRTMVDRIEPYQPNPLPISTGLGEAELVRELATMIMLYTVGWLAGGNWRSRIGYSAIAFGTWDIFYYIFLKVMTGWPRSIGDWDILFLIPLPWWGPVWAPVSIAALMIAWGWFASQSPAPEQRASRRWFYGLVGGLGAAIGLYVFMEDSLRTASQGGAALRAMLPVHFDWPVFTAALTLMTAPVTAAGRVWLREAKPSPPPEPRQREI